MTEVTTVKHLCEKIWELEKELGLLDFEIQGVKVWQALRMELYYGIAQSLGILEMPHTKKNGNKYKLNSLLSFLRSIVWYNPFFCRKKKEILVFEHPRKNFVDGKHIDIYTHYMIDDLKRCDSDFEVYEESYLGQHLGESGKNRKHLDIIRLFSKVYSLLPCHQMSSKEINKIRSLEDNIKEKLGTDIDLIKRFQKYVKRFWIRYFLFKKLFEIKSPRKIYVVVSYGLAPIVKAAKDKGIEVIELQHGVFSAYHLGYSFPGAVEGSLDYFPDRFLVWEDFWKNMCNLPLSKDKIEIRKYDYFEHKVQEFKGLSKDNRQIVVISQGVIGKRLSDFVLRNIDDLQDYRIIYKLHPGEYHRWRSYPGLVKLEKYTNVSILYNNEIPLYKIFAESKYVLGVFSTAVFEALNFNCELLLVDLPGIEYMGGLIDSGRAVRIDSTRSIRDTIISSLCMNSCL